MGKRGKFFTKQRVLSFLGVVAFIFIFVFLSDVTRNYEDDLRSFMGDDYIGMAVFVGLIVIEGILAPLSFLPLVAVASNLWGWVLAGFLSLLGWSIAAVIVFWFVRRYGICAIRHLIPLDKLAVINSYIPDKHVFASLIVLRAIFPSDLLNYALSIFTPIKFRIYFWSTVLGGMPFAFVIAYLGVIPLVYQVVVFIAGLLVISSIVYIASKSKNRMKRLRKIQKEMKKEEREACDLK